MDTVFDSQTQTGARDFRPIDAIRVLNSLATAFLLTNARGMILFANPSAAEVLGRPVEQVTGCLIDDLLAPLGTLLSSCSGDGPAEEKLGLPGQPGRLIGFRLSAIDGGSGEPQYSLVFRDITEWTRLREERDRLLRLAALGGVLPSILHEVKNPLAGIITAVEVLLEEMPEGDMLRQLHAVLGEVRRLKLNFEGLGLYQHDLRSARHAAVDFALREAFLVLQRQIEAKGIRGVCEVADMPLLPFDPAVIRAVLFNLVSNARHACREGDTITVQASLQDDGATFEMSVTDTGPGMSPDVLKRCKEMFFSTRRNGGGIGLALCQSVVERASGRLEVTSRPGQGTRVSVQVATTPETPPAP